MPIELPDLDDRTFDDLVAEAHALIPALAPDWTNHNPADPGVTVLELFAWITETLVFQLGRIPALHRAAFLALLDSTGTPSGPPGETPEERQRRILTTLRGRTRAVTAADYENLLERVWPTESGHPAPHRVLVVPGRDLGPEGRHGAAVVSVVVLPGTTAAGRRPELDDETRTSIEEFLHRRRIVATRPVVVGPEYVDVPVAAAVALREDAVPDDTLRRAEHDVADFLDPVVGGPDGTGWPFGRHVRTVELAAALARVPGIDYVEDTQLGEGRTGRDEIHLGARQLPGRTTVRLRAWDVVGTEHAWPAEASP